MPTCARGGTTAPDATRQLDGMGAFCSVYGSLPNTDATRRNSDLRVARASA
jgi:hypothetical protein